jgi:hypothetical protein
MTDYNCLADSIPNEELPDQNANLFDTDPVLRAPQAAIIGANSSEFQPTPGPDVRGDLSHPRRLARQQIPVQSSGDMAAGEFSGGQERTPQIKGLP